MNEKTRPAMAASIQILERPNANGTPILAAGYPDCNRGMIGQRTLDFRRDCHSRQMRWSGNHEEAQLSHEVNPYGDCALLFCDGIRSIETMWRRSLNQ